MQRREFVRSALATAAAATRVAVSGAETKPGGKPHQEYYQLRAYTLKTGPQLALTQRYFEQALIPGLNRLGISPVGTFKLDIGPETPTYYVLIPSTSAETLLSLDSLLEKYPEYVRGASGFLDAPASAPAFVRTERSILSAFSSWPKLTSPKLERRIFQLRTYESPSQAAHMRKIQMFNEAEIALFTKAGMDPVFFADTVVGTRMPNLTYMLTFPDLPTLTAHWAAFSGDPLWKDLSHTPGNTDAELISNITNLYLSPLSSSQI